MKSEPAASIVSQPPAPRFGAFKPPVRSSSLPVGTCDENAGSSSGPSANKADAPSTAVPAVQRFEARCGRWSHAGVYELPESDDMTMISTFFHNAVSCPCRRASTRSYVKQGNKKKKVSFDGVLVVESVGANQKLTLESEEGKTEGKKTVFGQHKIGEGSEVVVGCFIVEVGPPRSSKKVDTSEPAAGE